ncbi:hypothetical protein GCM10010433_43750 [Streptomyces pulveraceus]
MCNCTRRTGAPQDHPDSPGPAFPAGPEQSRTDPPKPARRPVRTGPHARFPIPLPDGPGRRVHGDGHGHGHGHKKIALDPAESSAIG